MSSAVPEASYVSLPDQNSILSSCSSGSQSIVTTLDVVGGFTHDLLRMSMKSNIFKVIFRNYLLFFFTVLLLHWSWKSNDYRFLEKIVGIWYSI